MTIMQAQKQLQYTISTQAIEKRTPSPAAIRLCKQMSSGKLTADSAVALLQKQYGLKERNRRA